MESGLLAWELKGLFVTQRHQTLIQEWPVAYHEISGRPQNWCLDVRVGHLPGGVRKKNQDGLYSVKVEVDSGGSCSSMPPEPLLMPGVAAHDLPGPLAPSVRSSLRTIVSPPARRPRARGG